MAMLEITAYDEDGLEIGTFNIPEGEVEIGYCFSGMEIIEVHAIARCGSDATVTIDFF